MKSINILSFLLLSSTLSLAAFAQPFTSENPIVLPTTSHDNTVLPEVYDDDGDPLRIGERYIINNPFLGVGAVYLYNIGNLTCPNAVILGKGTPVKFLQKSELDDGDVLVVTGGNVGNESDIFKIMKTDLVIPGGSKNVYKLLYCPAHLECKNIRVNFKDGYPRLTIVDDDKNSTPFVFIKA